MQSSFWIGATGLTQHQRALDVVANNVANVNTHGFKSSQVQFQDIFYQTIGLGGASQNGTRTVNPVQRGYGVDNAAIERRFTQGSPEETGRDLDLMILGPGFFVARPPDAQTNEPYYTRVGNFQIDANGGVTPGSPLDVATFSPPGPVNLVTPEGYVLQGVNSAIDATTGQYLLPATAALNDILIDPAGTLGPFATTQAGFGLNVDANQAIAIDPVTMPMEQNGVDRTIRLEFQHAGLDQTNGDGYYFFTAQDPAQNADGSFTPLNDALTGQPITGIVRVGAGGVVTGVYQNSDADQFLTDAEIAALAPWANVNGVGNPIFTVGTAPITGIVNEAATRSSGAAMVLTAPAAFATARAGFDAGTLSVTLNGNTMIEGVDYSAVAGTGVITPLTAWSSGPVVLNYTVGGGATQISNEQQSVINANPPQSFKVANVGIDAGTLVVNATRGGAALVENTDYTVNNSTGVITPVTAWDPGAVTVNYDQADSRVTVEHNVLNNPISFRDTNQAGSTVTVTPRDKNQLQVGSAMTAFDSLGNEHSLGYSFERLSENRWVWRATPTYRVDVPATGVVDNPAGGGVAADGVTVAPNALVANPDGTFQIKITIDEGVGPLEWTQLPSGAAWPATSSTSGYFQVTDPATGEIAFSRDINTASPNYAMQTAYASATAAGNGILGFDSLGNYDATTSSILTPLSFTPPGANAIAFTPDFTGLKQQGRQSDVTVVSSDGFKGGQLTTWGFDAEGRIVGDYSNGMQQFLARATLARFVNPEGMQARGENMFLQSSNSGARSLLFGGAQQNVGVNLIPGALETSNVDMSEEFTNMIVFQRAYQFNSRIITTSDEMVKEAIQLKR